MNEHDVVEPSVNMDDEIATGPAGGTSRPIIRRLLQVGRVIVVLAVIAAVAYAMISNWPDIVHTFRVLSWKSLVGTVVAIAVAMFSSVKLWQSLLKAMGTTVHYGHAAQVNLVGQLGKYLPGSVWAFVLQAQLGKRFKIPRARSLVAMLLGTGVSIVTALTLAPLIAPELADRYGRLMWILALGPLTLLLLLPPVLKRIANIALKAMRRVQLNADLHGMDVFRAILWSFVTWIAFGLHLWLLTGSLARQSLMGYAICVAAFALAMSAGFIAFVLPSGIGVREAILVATLAPIATAQQALAIALASRILFTFADLVSALGGVIASRLTLRTGGQHEATTEDLITQRRKLKE